MNISVIFLPRSLGGVSSSLLVQTSAGSFFYPVQGIGVASPYELQPFVNAVIPAGAMYELPISLSNPHAELLRVREVFTSEGFLHLSMPTGSLDGDSASVWLLPPNERRAIITLRFKTDEPGDYSGYAHIKTDFDTLIVPIGITVSKSGISWLPEVLDFGVLNHADVQVTLPLTLLSNLHAPPVSVVEVRTQRNHPSMKIQAAPSLGLSNPHGGLHNLMLTPLQPIEVVRVTFSGKIQVRLACPSAIACHSGRLACVGSPGPSPTSASNAFSLCNRRLGTGGLFRGRRYQDDCRRCKACSPRDSVARAGHPRLSVLDPP